MLLIQRYLRFLQVDARFLGLVFLLSYLLVIKNRISAGMISVYTLTPEGPVFQFFSALIIFSFVRLGLNTFYGKQHQPLPWQRTIGPSLAGLGVYLVMVNLMELGVAALFGNIERNFSSTLVLQRNLSLLVDAALFGGIYLAYSYRNKVQNYQQELAELRMRQLKNQLAPHFVFNALNTLDELIYSNSQAASLYLQSFAELYRGAINHGGAPLVPLQQELDFANHYFVLSNARFGENFALKVTGTEIPEAYLPPFSLQLLIENVFVHNWATQSKPIYIHLNIKAHEVEVINTVAAKQRAGRSGIGLRNLSAQLQLLGGKALRVEQNETEFKVSVPLFAHSQIGKAQNV